MLLPKFWKWTDCKDATYNHDRPAKPFRHSDWVVVNRPKWPVVQLERAIARIKSIEHTYETQWGLYQFECIETPWVNLFHPAFIITRVGLGAGNWIHIRCLVN